MGRLKNTLTTLGLGAGLMYFYDPDLGKRRRSLARDKAVRTQRVVSAELRKANIDLQNRAQGLAAQARGLFGSADESDWKVAERARAEMGRYVTHPGAINIDAADGTLYVSGHILNEEIDRLMAGLSKVRGVRSISNQLNIHATTEGVSELQGEGKPRKPQPELLQENWSPAARVATGVGGTLLSVVGMRRGGLPGLAMSLAGLGLATRGIANQPLGRFVGADGGRRMIGLAKSIVVNAPVQEVFAMWDSFANFPRFMAHVQEVTDLGEGRSFWKVAGPAGMPVEWEAVTTRRIANEVIAWKSVPGASVKSAGTVVFEPLRMGEGTRVTVRMTYTPPAGAVGHAVATLFGADPKQIMDEDLLRFKSLIETGKTSQGGFEVRYDRGAGARDEERPRAEPSNGQGYDR